MATEIKAYERNPHVLRKLIRFTGYIPANLIDDASKKVVPIKLLDKAIESIRKAKSNDNKVEIEYKGQKYNTRIAKINLDDTNKEIDEIELAVVS